VLELIYKLKMIIRYTPKFLPDEVVVEEPKKVEDLPRVESNLLYMDALNYARRYFKNMNFWDLDKPQRKIRKFVTAVLKAGYQLEVFIDEGI
jgi:hypothetical protein